MSETEPRSIIGRGIAAVRGFAIWLVGWAVLCGFLLAARFGRLWRVVGGTWYGIFYAYLALFFGGLIIVGVVGSADKIKSTRWRFAIQMLLCLLLAVLGGAVIVLATM